jgi:predicted phosphoribosyltransferase
LDQLADGITCLTSPPGFKAVADGYDDFREVTDSEVAELLTQAADALDQPLT